MHTIKVYFVLCDKSGENHVDRIMPYNHLSTHVEQALKFDSAKEAKQFSDTFWKDNDLKVKMIRIQSKILS